MFMQHTQACLLSESVPLYQKELKYSNILVIVVGVIYIKIYFIRLLQIHRPRVQVSRSDLKLGFSTLQFRIQ